MLHCADSGAAAPTPAAVAPEEARAAGAGVVVAASKNTTAGAAKDGGGGKDGEDNNKGDSKKEEKESGKEEDSKKDDEEKGKDDEDKKEEEKSLPPPPPMVVSQNNLLLQALWKEPPPLASAAAQEEPAKAAALGRSAAPTPAGKASAAKTGAAAGAGGKPGSQTTGANAAGTKPGNHMAGAKAAGGKPGNQTAAGTKKKEFVMPYTLPGWPLAAERQVRLQDLRPKKAFAHRHTFYYQVRRRSAIQLCGRGAMQGAAVGVALRGGRKPRCGPPAALQIPFNPRAVVLLIHGCAHGANNWWPQVGLPPCLPLCVAVLPACWAAPLLLLTIRLPALPPAPCRAPTATTAAACRRSCRTPCRPSSGDTRVSEQPAGLNLKCLPLAEAPGEARCMPAGRCGLSLRAPRAAPPHAPRSALPQSSPFLRSTARLDAGAGAWIRMTWRRS